jgi:hypothetical protein
MPLRGRNPLSSRPPTTLPARPPPSNNRRPRRRPQPNNQRTQPNNRRTQPNNQRPPPPNNSHPPPNSPPARSGGTDWGMTAAFVVPGLLTTATSLTGMILGAQTADNVMGFVEENPTLVYGGLAVAGLFAVSTMMKK